MTLLTGAFPKGFNLSKQCLQWMPYLGIYSWTNLRSIAPKHTVETLMKTLSVDYYYTYKTDMRIFLALGNILKPGQPWSVPVFSTYHSWLQRLKHRQLVWRTDNERGWKYRRPTSVCELRAKARKRRLNQECNQPGRQKKVEARV